MSDNRLLLMSWEFWDFEDFDYEAAVQALSSSLATSNKLQELLNEREHSIDRLIWALTIENETHIYEDEEQLKNTYKKYAKETDDVVYGPKLFAGIITEQISLNEVDEMLLEATSNEDRGCRFYYRKDNDSVIHQIYMNGEQESGYLYDPSSYGYGNMPGVDTYFKIETQFVKDYQNYTLSGFSDIRKYAKDGSGFVAYLAKGKLNSDTLDYLNRIVYGTMIVNDDVVTNVSEYDGSTYSSDALGDFAEISCSEIPTAIKNNDLSTEERFESFFEKEFWDKDIPVLYIDEENKEIENVDKYTLKRINNILPDLTLFIREYDYLEDY